MKIFEKIVTLFERAIFSLLKSWKTSIFVETRDDENSKTSIQSKKYYKYQKLDLCQKYFWKFWKFCCFFFEKFLKSFAKRWFFYWKTNIKWNFAEIWKFWFFKFSLFQKFSFFVKKCSKNRKNIFDINITFDIFNIFWIGLKFWKAHHL